MRAAFGSMMSGLLVASMTFGGGNLLASAADDGSNDPLADLQDLTIEETAPQAQSAEMADEGPGDVIDALEEAADPEPIDDSKKDSPPAAVQAEEQPQAEDPAVDLVAETSPPAPASRIPAEFETTQPPGVPQLDVAVHDDGRYTTQALSVPNPTISPKCGLNMAIVLDLSSSLSSGDVNQSKIAARDVVQELGGTPTNVGVYYFGTIGYRAIGKTSVATQAGEDTVVSAINGINRTSGIWYTNWQHPLDLVRQEGGYDVVLFVTDGQPNRKGANGTSTSTTDAIEAAKVPANALKTSGTRIVGIGVGSGISEFNIRQISGSASGDYYGIGSYDQLQTFLTELATGNCRGTVSVVKQEIGADGELRPGPNWEFSASTSTPGATVTPASALTAADGSLNFEVKHEDADEVQLTITETQKSGFQLEQQNGLNARCMANNAEVPVQNAGTHGFTLTVERSAVVSCSVINKEVVLYEPLTVSKTAVGSVSILHEWGIDKAVDKGDHNIAAGQSTDLTYTVNAEQKSRTMTAGTVTGKITVANPNDRPMVATVTDTLSSGEQCAITGVTDSDPATSGLQVNVPPEGLVMDYSCALTAEPTSTQGANTVKLTWDRADYPNTPEEFNNPGTAGTGTALDTENFTYSYVETGKTITVEDDLNGDKRSWDLTWQDGAAGIGKIQSNSYTVTKSPAAGTCETYTNVASIAGTSLSDTESIEVCSGADLVIDKTTAQSFSRSYNWDIEKTDLGSGPYTADPVTGEVTVDYRVTVTQGGYIDSGWLMSGTIVVQNPNQWQAIDVTVLDEADFGQGVQCTVTGVSGNTVIVDTDPAAPGFQNTIPADTSWTFNYSCSFTDEPNYEGTNVAVVEWDSAAASTPSSRATDEIEIVDADWDMATLNESATITDSHHTFLGGWNVAVGQGTDSRDYSVTWTVDEAGTCQTFTNTATLTGSDQLVVTSPATITACREANLTVDKTVTAQYDRQYLWTIDKGLPTGDPFGQFVDEEGNADYTYLVTIDKNGYNDTGWRMSGTITVSNPNDYAPVIATVSDSTTIEGATCVVNASSDINPALPGVQVAVPASGSTAVGYSCSLPGLVDADYSDHTNTATVTFGDGQSVSSGAVDVDFTIGVETDRVVDIFDDKSDPSNPVQLGSLNYFGILPWTYEYDMTYTSPPGVCTDYLNTAWVDTSGVDPKADHLAVVCGQTDLSLFATIDASYDRAYDWDVEKTADETRFDVAGDGTVTAEYEVVATASDPIDTDKIVTGMVRMTNPNTDIGDVDAIAIEATMTGSISIPGAVCTLDVEDENELVDGIQVILEGGEVLEILYSCTIPADTPVNGSYTNTVELEWGVDETVSYANTFEFDADTITDAVVDVTDTLPGRTPEAMALGMADAADSPVTFTYSEELAAEAGTCMTYENTAAVVQTGSDDTETVVVCAGADLQISKNVIHSFDRTFLWDIDKDASTTSIITDPDTGIATVGYTVTAVPRLAPDGWNDSAWQMSGEITVTNPNEWMDIQASVTDVVDIGGGATCTVTGGADVLVPRDASVTLPYSCTFTTQPDYSGTNTATVTWADTYSTPGTAASGTADIDVDEWSMDLHNTTVTVIDDKTDPANPVELGTATWNAEGTPAIFTYSLDLEGTPGTCVDYENTAWISQTGQEASTVTSVCDRADIEVVKTVEASFDRTYLWEIDKAAEETLLEVDAASGEGTFTYTVEAIPSGYADSDWAMSGTITVTNPNDFESITVDVIDAVDVGGGAVCTVVDGEDVVIEAGATETLEYDCTFESEPDYEGVNTVTVTSDLGEFTASADVAFDLEAEIDSSVTVMDDKTDESAPVELGSANWNTDGVPTGFTYDVTKIGLPGECVSYTNTAWIETSGDDPRAQLETSLCVSLDLEVDKTVLATYDREYHWDIAKSTDDAVININEETGSAEVAYLVEAIPSGYTDSGWEMSGEISVTNPNPHHPVTVTVTDVQDIRGATCTVEDGVDAVIDADSTSVFAYDCSFSEEPWYSGQNVAIVDVGGELFTDLVLVEFDIDEETDRTVTVMDDMTDPDNPVELGVAEWNADGVPVEFDYDLILEGVVGQCTTFENAAWLVFDGADDNSGPADAVPQFAAAAASVILETASAATAIIEIDLCVEADLELLSAADEVNADFDRTYLWDIDKSVDQSEMTLVGAGSAVLHYVVAVTPQGAEDSGHALTGSLTITNINEHVEPVVTVDQTATFEGLTCEIATEDFDPDMAGTQVLVPAQVDGIPGTATVYYDCAGEPDAYSGTVTASAAYQDANADDVVITATTAVDYTVDEEINKTITVLDDKTDPTTDPVIIGTADWNEEGIAAEFDYALRLDAVAGETVAYTNTAWIAETEQLDQETVEITADEPIIPIRPPAPKPPAPAHAPLPRTGVEGSGWLLALGGTALLLGGGLVFGTSRRRDES